MGLGAANAEGEGDVIMLNDDPLLELVGTALPADVNELFGHDGLRIVLPEAPHLGNNTDALLEALLGVIPGLADSVVTHDGSHALIDVLGRRRDICVLKTGTGQLLLTSSVPPA